MPRKRIKPRRIVINGRSISLRLEPEFWYWFRQIAAELGTSAPKLIEAIDKARNPDRSLSSTIRVFVACYLHDHPSPPTRPLRSVTIQAGWHSQGRSIKAAGHQPKARPVNRPASHPSSREEAASRTRHRRKAKAPRSHPPADSRGASLFGRGRPVFPSPQSGTGEGRFGSGRDFYSALAVISAGIRSFSTLGRGGGLFRAGPRSHSRRTRS